MMQRSTQYYKRKHYKKHMQVPPFREAKCQLGEELAKVLCDKCPESLKDEMRLSHNLNGPGQTLWISPSDLLIGKVVLKPPLTAKHIKALTHEGILNFGEDVETQWIAAMDEEKRLALENLEELLMLLAERDKKRALAEFEAKHSFGFEEYLQRLNAEFENVLKLELARLEETLRDYYETLMDQKEAECMDAQEEMLKARIQESINAVVQDMTEKFMHDLEEQERELEAMFNAKMEGQQERFTLELQYQEEVFQVMMRQLKHNLHCNNISNLMYVLCMERRKCMHDQQSIVDCTSQRIHDLEQEVEGNKKEIQSLHEQLSTLKRKVTIREDCLLGVLTQFQKFINYALRAVPTQAEFLLSVEKMMTFELSQALARTQGGHHPHLAKLFMPWRTISQENVSTPPSMTMRNYHNCLNEKKPPRTTPLREELYAINYKDHVYVREDFRNQVEQGLFRKASSVLWTTSMDHLVTLIKNANSYEEATVASEQSSDYHERSTSSTVHFQTPSSRADQPCLLAVRDSLYVDRDSFSSEKDFDYEIGHKSSQGLNLLAVTDSITLFKEKHLGTSNYLDTIGPEDEIPIAPKEVNPLSDPPAEATKTRATQINFSFEELTFFQAPSQATFRLRKAHRRETIIDEALLRNISEVTIKLNKHKIQESIEEPLLKQLSGYSTKAKKIKQPPTTSHTSYLSQHRDSLELVSQHLQANSKLKNIIMPTIPGDPVAAMQQLVINAPSDTRDFPDVNFKKIAQVFTELYTPEKPWEIYKKNVKSPPVVKQPVEPRTNFKKKRNVLKILGNKTSEVNDTSKDFTIHRIHSLMDILKKDDSLIRMFTRGGQ